MAADTTLALITTAEMKLFLKIAVGTMTEDAILDSLIDETSVWISNYCGRTLINTGADLTEYYDGDNEGELHLRNWPVVSITSLYVDALRTWAGVNAVDVAADVIVDADHGKLRLWNGQSSFERGVANIRIIYKAGYTHNTNVPKDLKLACKLQVAYLYFTKYQQRRIGVSSETIGDRTTSFKDYALLPDVEKICMRYKRWDVG